MERFLKVVVLLILSFSIILTYGYWHVTTHGAININLYDASADNNFTYLKAARVVLRDKDKQILAEGESETRHGIVYLSHPETGSCMQAEQEAHQNRNAWRECFRKHSVWLMHWVREIALIDVKVDDCMLLNIPVTVDEYQEDWWVWWIPLPHVGGKPYTYLSLKTRIDPLACKVIS